MCDPGTVEPHWFDCGTPENTRFPGRFIEDIGSVGGLLHSSLTGIKYLVLGVWVEFGTLFAVSTELGSEGGGFGSNYFKRDPDSRDRGLHVLSPDTTDIEFYVTVDVTL